MVESWPRLHATHAPPHYEQSALRNEFYFSHLEVAAVSTRLGCFSSVILPEVGFLICVNVSIRFLISQDHISLSEAVFRPFDGWDFEIYFRVVFTCSKFKMVEEQIIQILFSKAILMLSVSAKLHLHFCEVKHQCWL